MRCADCGCSMGRHGCVNCNEESYILDQYTELGMVLPSQEFLDTVEEQKRKEKERKREQSNSGQG